MIELIKTIRGDIVQRNIYLWDIGTRSMWVFYCAAIRGADILGFVTNDQNYYGEKILNRPILSPEEFRQKEDAVILMSDAVTSGTQELVEQIGECYRWSDVLEINPLLRNASISICGTDIYAWNLINEFAINHINIESFFTESEGKPKTILNIPVLRLPDIIRDDGNSIVLTERALRDMSIIDRIQNTGFRGTIFIPEIAQEANAWSINFWIMLNLAMRKNKRILFCCEDEMSRQLFRRFFMTYNIPVSREVCYAGSGAEADNDIWSLADESPNQSVLLIHAFSARRRLKIADAANDLGYSLENHNYAATDNVFLNHAAISAELQYEYDDKIGTSLDYSDFGGLPGWAVYGDELTADRRIMVLGGSTSSEVFYPENWVSKLYKKILSENKQVVIFNGAHAGNAVFHELNRLVRDIHFLKADIVISLSGYNDLSRANNKFESFRGENAFDYWRRMESYMKTIAEKEGAAFYAVLQPVNASPENRDLHEILQYHDQVHHKAKVFSENRKSNDFYYDLFTIFLHKPEMMIDLCHYSEAGNEALACKIFDIIKDKL